MLKLKSDALEKGNYETRFHTETRFAKYTSELITVIKIISFRIYLFKTL